MNNPNVNELQQPDRNRVRLVPELITSIGGGAIAGVLHEVADLDGSSLIFGGGVATGFSALTIVKAVYHKLKS